LETPHAFPNFVLEFCDALMADPIHSIDRRITLIGRHASCAIQLNRGHISRVHCSLVLTPAGLWVIDLLGKGGTSVEERRVRCSRLSHKSVMAVGDFQIRVRGLTEVDPGFRTTG
jgi:pSer/pThr/pTyr-binding forkhead associated (FHA) protein